MKFANRLAGEKSPYLLQHAHNPVDWYPWGQEALDKARSENRLILISIGYSACHWCHVMERESFEDEQIAKLMNDNFICIKVDREERPDIDQFYMDAANLMVGRGGWPLNAFALPDTRPVYAGTYFPKPQWSGLLRELSFGYRKEPEKYIAYADKLTSGIKGLNLIENPDKPGEISESIHEGYLGFAQFFDRKHGGRGKPPKFPMPDNYTFLLRYWHQTGKKEAIDQAILTLEKMRRGGIYDQLGGGFARYSTDADWLVPHFEKMLYDNALLICLYSEAYQATGIELFKDTVFQTFNFLRTELMSPEGAFYCALDADSEGVEGKFYTWTEEEFDNILGLESLILKEYFGIGQEGYWEDDLNIPVLAKPVAFLAAENGLSETELQAVIDKGIGKLQDARSKRVPPGLDNKILLSWNALVISGLSRAFSVFGDNRFMDAALNCINYINKNLSEGDLLFHTEKSEGARVPGFLEDYAFFIAALVEYYQVTFESAYLEKAKKLCEKTIADYFDPATGYFYFTSKENTEVPTRKIENADNVIASPNSVMAQNLFYLGKYYGEEKWLMMSRKMLDNILPRIAEFLPFYSNWATFALQVQGPFYEVAVSGKKAVEVVEKIREEYRPNLLFAASENISELSILRDRFKQGKRQVYICRNNTCELPVETAEEAINLIEQAG